MNLLSRLRGERFTVNDYLEWFKYGGNVYPAGVPTLQGSKPVEIGNSFAGYVASVHKRSGTVAAAVAARALLIQQLRFKWRNAAEGQAGRLFGTNGLAPLEGPGRAPLLHLAETHVSYGGTAFFYMSDRVRLLRPDWVQIVLGSDYAPDEPAWQADAEIVGYVYKPGGPSSSAATQTFTPGEVSRWMPEPDPVNPWRGESWVTAVLREITTDGQATDHLAKFYEHAATPQMVFTVDPTATQEQVTQVADAIRQKSEGTANAYRSLVLGGGAQATVVGGMLNQLDYQGTQGGHETRIAARSRVPAVVLGIREGMQGSALNAGNYQQTRRLWADGWFSAAADSLCAALEPLLERPPGPVELSYDPARIPFLQEDRKDEADIFTATAQGMRQLFDGGWEPDSIRDAVIAGMDWSQLRHEGRPSVQVQPDPARVRELERDDMGRVLRVVER